MMLRKTCLTGLLLVVVAIVPTSTAVARYTTLYGHMACQRSGWYPWHGPNYHTAWRAPVALVVPPTAGAMTNWRWGVSGTRITPTWHQFTRPYPGAAGVTGAGFAPTPVWPSDTSQFGVYPVRGPW